MLIVTESIITNRYNNSLSMMKIIAKKVNDNKDCTSYF